MLQSVYVYVYYPVAYLCCVFVADEARLSAELAWDHPPVLSTGDMEGGRTFGPHTGDAHTTLLPRYGRAVAAALSQNKRNI